VRCAISPNDPRIAVLVAALDADGVPMAETWRQVAAAAERAGMRRPSYGHVRRLTRLDRRRRELERQGRAVWGKVATTLAAGRVPSAELLLEATRGTKAEQELVLQEHKAFSDAAAPGAGAGAGGGAGGEARRGATGPARRSRGP
jgi:hypothetical protein